MKRKESRYVFIAVLVILGFVFGVGLLPAQENYIYTGDKRIETSTNIVRALYRINSRSYSGTAEQIARTYLQENREQLQIDGSVDQFKAFDIKESPAGHHVAFRQTHHGIPIWESETVVSINADDRVTMVVNGFQPQVDVSSVPVVTKVSAISLAANALSLSEPDQRENNGAELWVYNKGNQNYTLVWYVKLFSLQSPADWGVIVDALSGEILEKWNATIEYEDGQGKVFHPDPVTELQDTSLPDNDDNDYAQLGYPGGVYKDVTLRELNDSFGQYRLRGHYAYSFDKESPNILPVTQTTPNFLFNREPAAFEEVNIYYHVDDMRRYVGSLSPNFTPTWNFTGADPFATPGLTDEAVVFDFSGNFQQSTRRYAVYYPMSEYLSFGDGTDASGEEWFDAGEDHNVIRHEYGHALHDAFTPGGVDNDGWESSSASEGLSDYLAISYRRTIEPVFLKDVVAPWYDRDGRTLNRAATYPDNWSNNNSRHENGRLWATTLIKMEEPEIEEGGGLSRDVVTTNMLTSLFYVTGNSTIIDFVNAMLQADQDVYGGNHTSDLEGVFDSQGFLEEVSGTIASNTTWQGLKHVTGGVTVNAGVTLTIAPGTILKFDPSVSLIINGTLVAQGTASNPITFTSADGDPQRSEWGTVYIYGSNNTVEHCVIEGSDWGLKFYGKFSPTSGNVVRNCTLRQNDQAIRAENTELEVYDTLIEDNRHAFVLLSNPNGIYLDGNIVKDNDRDGIYCGSSVVDVFNCTFDNNGMGDTYTIHGILAANNSDIALGSRVWDENLSVTGGYNTVKNSHGAGIFVESTSMVLLGDKMILPTTTVYTAGNNSIHDNGTKSGTFNGKEVYNYSSTTVEAHKNYWGGTPTSGMFDPPVDYADWLSSPPAGPSSPATKIPLVESTGTNDDTEIKKEIIQNLRNVIARSPESREAVAALRTLFSIIRTDRDDKLKQRSTIYGYLEGLYNSHPTLELGKVALQYMIVDRHTRGKFGEAIVLAEGARAKLSGIAAQENLVTLIFLYLHSGQTKMAESVFADFKARYPNEKIFTELLHETFEHQNPGQNHASTSLAKTTTHSQTSEAAELPTEFAIAPNYPNPFNPSTSIRYHLPEDTEVTLTIYNMLGQPVRTLVQGRKTAGVHTIRWDGTNDAGALVASGTYLVRLAAGEFVDVQKVAFVK